MSPTPALLARVGAAGCLAASGVIHAELYLHGYRSIPAVGPAFLLQASGSFAVALLLLVTATVVPRLAAAALAAGALVGFILSRTVGVFGFIEYGLQPAPQALISVLLEVAVLGLLAIPLLHRTALSPTHTGYRLVRSRRHCGATR
ncbi:MAG TPA: hypothetical protein VIY28_01710 [Pseudonocardiaceae bacterium]